LGEVPLPNFRQKPYFLEFSLSELEGSLSQPGRQKSATFVEVGELWVALACIASFAKQQLDVSS
jgi:hypothetical protein